MLSCSHARISIVNQAHLGTGKCHFQPVFFLQLPLGFPHFVLTYIHYTYKTFLFPNLWINPFPTATCRESKAQTTVAREPLTPPLLPAEGGQSAQSCDRLVFSVISLDLTLATNKHTHLESHTTATPTEKNVLKLVIILFIINQDLHTIFLNIMIPFWQHH